MSKTNLKNMYRNNLIYFIIFITCFILMLINSLNDHDLIEICAKFIFDSEYRSRYFIISDLPDVALNVPQNFFGFIEYNIITNHFTFDTMIIAATSIFQILIPFTTIFTGIAFYKKYNSIDRFSLVKAKSYRKEIYKKILFGSVKLASAVFLAYLCMFILFHFTITDLTTVVDEAGSRPFLLDLLPTNFYLQHIKIYYLIEGFFRFFYIPFIYTMLIQSAVLIFSNFRDIILTNIVYYFGLSTIHSMIKTFFMTNIPIINYFNPALFMANGDLMQVNSILIIFTNSIPLFLSIICIEWRSRHVEI